uniref:Uncharacterized protein n=1 Tax=viral metagenome TaxID=1070528 RepID=A0A6M3KUT3_9ZZZZ
MIVKPVTTVPAQRPVVKPVERELKGEEAKLATASPNVYAALRTAADIIPFGSFAFESGREEFMESSTAGKATHLMLDAAVFLPFGWIGKGLKVTTRPIVSPISKQLRKIPFGLKSVESQPKAFVQEMTEKLQKFQYDTPKAKLVQKYGLSSVEADMTMKNQPWIWEVASTRSGAMVPSYTEGMKKVFTKSGKLQKKVKDDLERWSLPRSEQRLLHYKQEWKRHFGQLVGRDEVKLGRMFKASASEIFGSERAAQLTLENIGAKDFSKILSFGLLNEGKLMGLIDTSVFAYLYPVRKVFGKFELLFGAHSKVYLPLKAMHAKTNEAAFMEVANFQTFLQSRNLGKISASNVGRYKFKPMFSRAEWDEAGQLARKLDDLKSKGEATTVIQAEMEKSSVIAQKIYKSYEEWTDHMYAQHMKVKIPQLLEKAGLTSIGENELNALLQGPKGIEKIVDHVFAAGHNLDYKNKLAVIDATLNKLRKTVDDNPHWFKGFDDPAMAEELGKKLELLKKDLTFARGKGRGFINYLENYATRVSEGARGTYGTRQAGIGVPKRAGYTRGRLLEESLEASEDLTKMVEVRARMQARELYAFPVLPKIAEDIATLPPRLKSFSEHYAARLLGQPSPVDERVAAWLNARFSTRWDDRRVMNLAWKINDLIYMGGIGFKPFSAMRNYFQPLLNVPADLGGLRDIGWLLRGYGRAFDKSAREYIRSIGAIQEYAPDLLFSIKATPYGHRLQQVRDMAMWMFKNSDRHNRYVTGGAALAKWEHFFNKFAKETKFGRVLDKSGLEKFKSKLNINSRESWVRAEMNRHLSEGTLKGMEEAKKLWVNDVIADTQYLYGAADSPLVSHAGGVIGKTAAVFQTWWMNYASLLDKWMFKTGDPGDKAKRMFTWMLSSAAAYHIMEQMWGESTAARTVFTGPLPLDFDIPATWKPFRDGIKTSLTAAGALIGVADPETAKKQALATLRSSMMFAPGGLQILQTYKGAQKEGWEGIAKSIVRYHGGD